MKLKKIGAVLLSVAMMGTMLAGCNSSTSTDTNQEDTTADVTESADKAETTSDNAVSGTITVWEHAYSFEDSLKDVIAGFEKQYPDVDVQYEIKDGQDYYSILSTAIQSGDGPDLFWTNGTATSNMTDFVTNDVCYNLTDAVDLSLFDENTLKITQIDGKSYSIPWLTMDTRTVYYNKDLFSENGWTVPTSFNEFEALLETVKNAGYTPISLCAMDPYSLLFAFEPILSAYDVNYTKGLSDYSVSATDKPVADTLNLMLDWANKGYYGDNWLGVADGNAQILAFTSGKAAMSISGSWDAATISQNNPDLNFGAFAVPAEDGTTGLVGTPANGFSVNAASKNMDAALAFANYCASLEAQTVWVQSQGAVSASQDIEASSDIAKEISEGGKGNIYTSWQSVLANHSADGTAATIWSEDFPKVFSGDLTVDDFLNEISEVMK